MQKRDWKFVTKIYKTENFTFQGNFPWTFHSTMEKIQLKKNSTCIQYRGKVIFRYVDKVNIFMSEYGHGLQGLKQCHIFVPF